MWQSMSDYAARGEPGDPRGRKSGVGLWLTNPSFPARAEGKPAPFGPQEPLRGQAQGGVMGEASPWRPSKGPSPSSWFRSWSSRSMIQRGWALFPRSFRFVSGGSVDRQDWVGSASPVGPSISSHSSAYGSAFSSSRCAGRTRTAAKRDRHFRSVPSRQVTCRKAVVGKLIANCLTETG